MNIYGFETFNVSKCTLTAEFAGIAYEYVALDPRSAEHKTPEHLLRHPLGKVPALELDDGRCLFESGAICRYLGRISERGVYPNDPWMRSQIDSWMHFAEQHVGRWMVPYFFQEVVRHRLQGQPVDESAIAEGQGWLDQQLPVVERQLSEHPYLTGEDLTIADTFTAAYVQIHEVTSLDLGAYPGIQAWFGRLRSDPAYDRAMSHFRDGQLFH